MGGIIFWGIVRTALMIAALWILFDYIEYQYWFVLTIMSVYGIIIHPAVIQYRLFSEENKAVLEGTLCSSCKHFERSAVLCAKHDEHPTQNYIPCDGIDWEPKLSDIDREEKYY